MNEILTMDTISLNQKRSRGQKEDPEGHSGEKLFDAKRLQITAEAIGGLDSAEFRLGKGATALVGQNATNRSSVLRGIAATLGADLPSESLLRTDADTGEVSIESVGDNEPDLNLNLHLDRGKAGKIEIDRDGNITPTWSQSDVTNFVSLIKTNPIRTAVTRGNTSDLYAHLMAPVDIDQLEKEIDKVKSQRQGIESEIDTLEKKRSKLPDLERKLQDINDSIESKSNELKEARERVDELEVQAKKAQEAENLIDELEKTRQELKNAENELKLEREEIEDLQQKREETEQELESLNEPSQDINELDKKISELLGERRSLNASVDELQQIIDFTKRMLEDDSVLEPFRENDDILSNLNPDQNAIHCWTCGSAVQQDAITTQVQEIKDLVSDRRSRLSEINSQIEDLREEKNSLERSKNKRQRLQDRLNDIDRDLEVRNSTVHKLEQDIEELESEVNELESKVNNVEKVQNTDILEHYQRVSEYKVELNKYEKTKGDIEREIADIESQINEIPSLEEKKDNLNDELRLLREYVVNLEKTIVEEFNKHMENIINKLDYGKISRIWIERKVEGSNNSHLNNNNVRLELHIIRESSENGTTYEDGIMTLSESEREVVGLTVAIAGYISHDISESLPILLLDSLESIDASRLKKLHTYLINETDIEYIISALLPGDAEDMPSIVTKNTPRS